MILAVDMGLDWISYSHLTDIVNRFAEYNLTLSCL